MTTVADYFEIGLRNTLQGALYGLELEIEDLRELEFVNNEFWEIKTDGSLRNNGYEFVSCPLKKQDIPKALDLLFNKVKTTEKSYSERTSIHVHCNMRDSSMEEVRVFCMLYLLFEKIFFRFVDKERSNNIFCVPLSDFTCPERLNRDLGGDSWSGQFSWEKYSALNIIPLHNLGTVEFRHMEGHDNKARIIQWVDLIDCLKTASQRNSIKEVKEAILQLNTNSEYARFAEGIFGEHLSNIRWEEYKELMYEAVMRCKLWELIEQNTETKPKKKPKKEVPWPGLELGQAEVVATDPTPRVITTEAAAGARAPHLQFRITPDQLRRLDAGAVHGPAPVRITDENVTPIQLVVEERVLREAMNRWRTAMGTEMTERMQANFIRNHRNDVYNSQVNAWLTQL